jgi:hypothetical protein
MATYTQNGIMKIKDMNGDTHIVSPITKDECVELSDSVLTAYGLAAGSKADDVLAKLGGGVLYSETPVLLSDILGNLITIPSAQLDKQVQIAVGSYVGTGTYGASNKNSIPLAFVPKIVIITLDSTTLSNGEEGFPLVLINPSTYTWASDDTYQTIAWSDNTVTWYNTASAQFQHNTDGLTFRYTVIG